MKLQRIWFDPPHVRWGRVLATAALVFAPVLGWMAHERGVFESEDETGRVAAIRVATVAASPAARPVALRTAGASQRDIAAASAPRPAAAGEIEVCGLGTVKSDEDDKEAGALAAARRSISPKAGAAWHQALLASPDVRVRAAGLYVGPLNTQPVDERPDPREADCAGNPTCIWQLDQDRMRAAEALRAEWRDPLARLALESRDPVVYALAMNLCRQVRHAAAVGACQLLSHEQWTAIDPDNAAPWLLRAEAVSGSELAETMDRVARAKHIKSYGASLLPLVMEAQPPGTPPLDRMLVSIDVVAIQTAWPVRSGAVLPFCSAVLLRDANRRQTCEAMAGLFLNHSDSLVHLNTGIGLGERLGWPAERLAALREERDGLFQVEKERVAGEPLGCEAAKSRVSHFGDVARLGEAAALRAELRRSGKSLEVLARTRRDFAQAIQRSASVVTGSEPAASGLIR